MAHKYYCNKCNYGSENKYNYSTHLKTSKHINQLKSINDPNLKISIKDTVSQKIDTVYQKIDTISQKNEIFDKNVIKSSRKADKTLSKKQFNPIKCEFCNKSIPYANNRTRHYNICKEKKFIDNENTIEQLKHDKELAEQKANEAIKSKQELEKDYREHVKTTTEMLKNCNTTINNNSNNTIIDKRQMNIYYVIDTYKDAYNYDDLMSNKLTRAEKNHIRNFGPSAGCESLIMNRCVNGIPKDKRPFHCLDASREKFVYRTDGEWAIDLNGDKIMAPAMAQVRTQFDITDTNTDIDDRVNSQRLLLDMDMNARKRTMKNLKKATMLKN